jgi:hypothetical protein
MRSKADGFGLMCIHCDQKALRRRASGIQAIKAARAGLGRLRSRNNSKRS